MLKKKYWTDHVLVLLILTSQQTLLSFSSIVNDPVRPNGLDAMLHTQRLLSSADGQTGVDAVKGQLGAVAVAVDPLLC